MICKTLFLNRDTCQGRTLMKYEQRLLLICHGKKKMDKDEKEKRSEEFLLETSVFKVNYTVQYESHPVAGTKCRSSR